MPSPVGAVAGRGDLRVGFFLGSGRLAVAVEEDEREMEETGFGPVEEEKGSELGETEDSGVGGVGALLIGVSVIEDPPLLWESS